MNRQGYRKITIEMSYPLVVCAGHEFILPKVKFRLGPGNDSQRFSKVCILAEQQGNVSVRVLVGLGS